MPDDTPSATAHLLTNTGTARVILDFSGFPKNGDMKRDLKRLGTPADAKIKNGEGNTLRLTPALFRRLTDNGASRALLEAGTLTAQAAA